MNKITNSSNIQFRSLNIMRTSTKRKLCQAYTANVLSQNIDDVVKLTKFASPNRLSFWEMLAEHYNTNNFYRTTDKKENSELANIIYAKVKRPNKLHRYIVSNFSESFENINKIFTCTKNNKKSLEFVKKVNEDIFGGEKEKNKELIIQLLESPHKNKYIKNYNDIKSYLILNKDNENAVADLDEMFSNKTFVPEVYNRKMQEKAIKSSWNLTPTKILNSDIYYKNYSRPAEEVISDLSNSFLLSNDIVQNGGDKYILNIMKTTSKNNKNLRQDLIKIYGGAYSYNNTTQKRVQILKELDTLFNILDNNEQARIFVKDSLKKLSYCISLSELNNILIQIPSGSLNIFRKNALRIISLTRGENRINALKNEIQNPFFETPESLEYKNNAIERGYIKKPSLFKNLTKQLENYFNILRYSQIKDTTPEFIPIKETKPYIKPEVIIKAPEQELEPVKKEIPTTKVNNKELIKNTVLELVAKKLGTKTFDRQKVEFADKATKMRFNMLPEIFMSISETKKANKIIGKRTMNSSNKDALALYSRINGNNKKFINYLLKKRNINNTRMFEVKQIIEMIDKAEAQIKKQKAANPNYRARDARRYYNHLYEAKIQQYGKVTRPKKDTTLQK